MTPRDRAERVGRGLATTLVVVVAVALLGPLRRPSL